MTRFYIGGVHEAREFLFIPVEEDEDGFNE